LHPVLDDDGRVPRLEESFVEGRLGWSVRCAGRCLAFAYESFGPVMTRLIKTRGFMAQDPAPVVRRRAGSLIAAVSSGKFAVRSVSGSE